MVRQVKNIEELLWLLDELDLVIIEEEDTQESKEVSAYLNGKEVVVKHHKDATEDEIVKHVLRCLETADLVMIRGGSVVETLPYEEEE